MTISAEKQTVDLTPYVPRVVIEWLRETPAERRRTLVGSLVFVDISGFTAMSERLAGKGNLGAEEVTGVMNRTFTRLLDVAYAAGGGLLKFGGDALLLFFSGDGHEARACDAAHGMRRALRELGPPETSAGRVTLKMHVGIHSGSFDFFLVGESHRELLLAGAGVTRTVEMESAAEAGEILVSDATAAALPARTLGEERAGGYLLKAAPGAAGELAPLPPFRGVDVSVCVPAPIRRHLDAGKDEPEHRQACVAFVRFDLDGVDGDALEDPLEELVVTTQRIAEEHGTTFLETDIDEEGGKIVLVAGVPQTEGEDEERLLRTVRGIADAAPRLPLRIGASRGRVFAGEVGAPFRRTYTILGTTAALAARLMAKAERGQILTTPDVLERTRSGFQTAELEPLRLKGIAEPVAARAVLAVGATRAAIAPERHLPFVGRERELAILSAALAPVRMGFGNLVELIGEPGLGKSRLVEEVRAQTTDLVQVATACEQYEASTSYFAFRGMLRSLLELPANGAAPDRLRARVEDLAPELLPWLPLIALPLDIEVESTREVDELEPAFRRARLHGVLETLLAKLLPDATLLVLEDVHWMDEASAELLRHLGSQVSSKPWLVCATRRPVEGGFSAAEGVPPIPAMTIHLEPLSAEAAQELVGSAAEQALLQHEVAAITDRAGGNPLFLQELVASSRAPEEEALPESVEGVVAARIDKLPPPDRALLRYAAVLGATFSADLVRDVLSEDPSASTDSEAWDRLAEFVERDPYTPGAFRFRHALFRDAAYEGLSYRRRRELHARVGEAYERRDPEATGEHAELLSLHFFHAGDHEKTYRYSLGAGDRARDKFSNVEAATFYRRALDAAKQLPHLEPAELALVWEALGDVSELAGLYADAAEAYKSARRLSEHPQLFLKEGVIRERVGRYADALRWYKRGLRAAEALESDEDRIDVTLELQLAYAGVRYRQGKFADCIASCRQVVQTAAALPDLLALAHAYYLQHLAYTSLGSPEKQALRGLALPIYEELGDLLGQANVLNNLGIDAYYDGRWDEALELYERSKELRERIGDVVGAATITNNIGEVKSDQGLLQSAEELFGETVDVCDRANYRYMALLATSNLGRAAARSGRADEARKLLLEALAGFHEIQAASFVLETKARLAEAAVFAGDPAEALRQADEALRASEATGGVGVLGTMLHRLRAYALMQAGDLDGAAAALGESIATARERDELYELALSLEAAARLAELCGNDGAAEAEESKMLLARLGVVSTPDVPL